MGWCLLLFGCWYNYVDTGVVISIRYSSEDSPQNKNNNCETVIGYLDSYFEYFDCHDTTVTVDKFKKFLDARGYLFIKYRPLSSLPTFMCIPLTSLLTLVHLPFIQCMYHLGLPFIVVKNILNPLQYFRLRLTYYCAKCLMTNEIYIVSCPHTSFWNHPHQPLSSQICAQISPWDYLWVSPSISNPPLSLPSFCHCQLLIIVSILE